MYSKPLFRAGAPRLELLESQNTNNYTEIQNGGILLVHLRSKHIMNTYDVARHCSGYADTVVNRVEKCSALRELKF